MGSPNGLWTAVSGGMAQSQNVDTIANNLANANTAGFKKDTPTFKEFLTAVERPPSPDIDIPRTAFKDSDFYHFDGREHAMVNVDKVHTDHSQGSLRPTNTPLDFAIEGGGFFTIQTPGGLMFTRSGDFKVNGQGQLVTSDGHAVLALAGEAAAAAAAAKNAQEQNQAQNPAPARTPAGVNPFANPVIAPSQDPNLKPNLAPLNLREALASGERLNVGLDGQVFVGEQLIGTLAIAEFSDARMLQKTTMSLYANSNPANVPKMADGSQVRQGFLESSNVNPVSELMNLLKANRMYESNMRAIKAYNDMSSKEANEVGKL